MSGINNNPTGKVIFAGIKQLPDLWWTDPNIDVWQVWDKNTYYLWGANQGNYNLAQGQRLMGAGMAGPKGPTRGYAHDHYVGLDTMDYSDTRNPGVFKKLDGLLSNGQNIVVPTYHGCCSLGTGIGSTGLDWVKIQIQLFQGLLSLITKASAVDYGHQTFWPDCRTLDTTNDNPPIQCSICLDPFRSNLNVHAQGVVPIYRVC